GAPELSAVARGNRAVRIVGQRRDHLDAVASPREPVARIGHERWNPDELGRVVRRPDEDLAHARTATTTSLFPKRPPTALATRRHALAAPDTPRCDTSSPRQTGQARASGWVCSRGRGGLASRGLTATVPERSV